MQDRPILTAFYKGTIVNFYCHPGMSCSSSCSTQCSGLVRFGRFASDGFTSLFGVVAVAVAVAVAVVAVAVAVAIAVAVAVAVVVVGSDIGSRRIHNVLKTSVFTRFSIHVHILLACAAFSEPRVN